MKLIGSNISNQSMFIKQTFRASIRLFISNSRFFSSNVFTQIDSSSSPAFINNSKRITSLMNLKNTKLTDELFSNNTKHITSCSKIEELFKESIPEVAFIGRSNVGKSSLINSVVRNSKLVKTSKTPVCC